MSLQSAQLQSPWRAAAPSVLSAPSRTAGAPGRRGTSRMHLLIQQMQQAQAVAHMPPLLATHVSQTHLAWRQQRRLSLKRQPQWLPLQACQRVHLQRLKTQQLGHWRLQASVLLLPKKTELMRAQLLQLRCSAELQQRELAEQRRPACGQQHCASTSQLRTKELAASPRRQMRHRRCR